MPKPKKQNLDEIDALDDMNLDSMEGMDDMDFDDFDRIDFDADPSFPGGPAKRKELVGPYLKAIGTGAIDGIKGALRSHFSETSSMIDEAVGWYDDGINAYQEFNEDLKEAGRNLGKTVAKGFPLIKQLMPEKVYGKINSWLDDFREAQGAEESEEQRNARMQQETIGQALGEIFEQQQVSTEQQIVDNKIEKHIDRTLAHKQFMASQRVLTSMDSRLAYLAKFAGGPYTAYLKKSLELKFQTYFAAKDLLTLHKVYVRMAEAKLEEIKTNTALPDSSKVDASENERRARLKEGKYDKNSILGNLRSAVFDNLKRKGKEAFASVADGAGMLDMLIGMGEMQAEMGDVITPQKAIAFALRQGMGWLTKKALNSYMSNDQDTNYGVRATEAKYRGFIPRMYAQIVGRAKEWRDSDSMIKRILGSLIPETEDDTKVDQLDLARDATKAARFDVITRQSIIDIIPRHLERIGDLVENLHQEMTGTDYKDIKHKTYNYQSGLIEDEEMIAKQMMETTFGSFSTNKYYLRNISDTLKAAAKLNVNKEEFNDIRNYEKEYNKVVQNLALDLDANLRPIEFLVAYITMSLKNGTPANDKYEMPEFTSYMTQVFDGVTDTSAIFTILKFMTEAMWTSISFNDPKSSVINQATVTSFANALRELHDSVSGRGERLTNLINVTGRGIANKFKFVNGNRLDTSTATSSLNLTQGNEYWKKIEDNDYTLEELSRLTEYERTSNRKRDEFKADKAHFTPEMMGYLVDAAAATNRWSSPEQMFDKIELNPEQVETSGNFIDAFAEKRKNKTISGRRWLAAVRIVGPNTVWIWLSSGRGTYEDGKIVPPKGADAKPSSMTNPSYRLILANQITKPPEDTSNLYHYLTKEQIKEIDKISKAGKATIERYGRKSENESVEKFHVPTKEELRGINGFYVRCLDVDIKEFNEMVYVMEGDQQKSVTELTSISGRFAGGSDSSTGPAPRNNDLIQKIREHLGDKRNVESSDIQALLSSPLAWRASVIDVIPRYLRDIYYIVRESLTHSGVTRENLISERDALKNARGANSEPTQKEKDLNDIIAAINPKHKSLRARHLGSLLQVRGSYTGKQAQKDKDVALSDQDTSQNDKQQEPVDTSTILANAGSLMASGTIIPDFYTPEMMATMALSFADTFPDSVRGIPGKEEAVKVLKKFLGWSKSVRRKVEDMFNPEIRSRKKAARRTLKSMKNQYGSSASNGKMSPWEDADFGTPEELNANINSFSKSSETINQVIPKKEELSLAGIGSDYDLMMDHFGIEHDTVGPIVSNPKTDSKAKSNAVIETAFDAIVKFSNNVSDKTTTAELIHTIDQIDNSLVELYEEAKDDPSLFEDINTLSAIQKRLTNILTERRKRDAQRLEAKIADLNGKINTATTIAAKSKTKPNADMISQWQSEIDRAKQALQNISNKNTIKTINDFDNVPYSTFDTTESEKKQAQAVVADKSDAQTEAAAKHVAKTAETSKSNSIFTKITAQEFLKDEGTDAGYMDLEGKGISSDALTSAELGHLQVLDSSKREDPLILAYHRRAIMRFISHVTSIVPKLQLEEIPPLIRSADLLIAECKSFPGTTMAARLRRLNVVKDQLIERQAVLLKEKRLGERKEPSKNVFDKLRDSLMGFRATKSTKLIDTVGADIDSFVSKLWSKDDKHQRPGSVKEAIQTIQNTFSKSSEPTKQEEKPAEVRPNLEELEAQMHQLEKSGALDPSNFMNPFTKQNKERYDELYKQWSAEKDRQDAEKRQNEKKAPENAEPESTKKKLSIFDKLTDYGSKAWSKVFNESDLNFEFEGEAESKFHRDFRIYAQRSSLILVKGFKSLGQLTSSTWRILSGGAKSLWEFGSSAAVKAWDAAKFTGKALLTAGAEGVKYGLRGIDWVKDRAVDAGILALDLLSSGWNTAKGIFSGALDKGTTMSKRFKMWLDEQSMRRRSAMQTMKDKYENFKSDVKGLKFINKFFEKRWFDVFEKDKVDPANPLLTAAKQQAGIFDKDGNQYKSTREINGAVFEKGENNNLGNCLISEDQYKAGLVDVENQPIGQKEFSNWKFKGFDVGFLGHGLIAALGGAYELGRDLLGMSKDKKGRLHSNTLLGMRFGIDTAAAYEYRESMKSKMDRLILYLEGSRTLNPRIDGSAYKGEPIEESSASRTISKSSAPVAVSTSNEPEESNEENKPIYDRAWKRHDTSDLTFDSSQYELMRNTRMALIRSTERQLKRDVEKANPFDESSMDMNMWEDFSNLSDSEQRIAAEQKAREKYQGIISGYQDKINETTEDEEKAEAEVLNRLTKLVNFNADIESAKKIYDFYEPQIISHFAENDQEPIANAILEIYKNRILEYETCFKNIDAVLKDGMKAATNPKAYKAAKKAKEKIIADFVSFKKAMAEEFQSALTITIKKSTEMSKEDKKSSDIISDDKYFKHLGKLNKSVYDTYKWSDEQLTKDKKTTGQNLREKGSKVGKGLRKGLKATKRFLFGGSGTDFEMPDLSELKFDTVTQAQNVIVMGETVYTQGGAGGRGLIGGALNAIGGGIGGAAKAVGGIAGGIWSGAGGLLKLGGGVLGFGGGAAKFAGGVIKGTGQAITGIADPFISAAGTAIGSTVGGFVGGVAGGAAGAFSATMYGGYKLLEKLVQVQFIDDKGNLTEAGKSLTQSFLEYKRMALEEHKYEDSTEDDIYEGDAQLKQWTRVYKGQIMTAMSSLVSEEENEKIAADPLFWDRFTALVIKTRGIVAGVPSLKAAAKYVKDAVKSALWAPIDWAVVKPGKKLINAGKWAGGKVADAYTGMARSIGSHMDVDDEEKIKQWPRYNEILVIDDTIDELQKQLNAVDAEKNPQEYSSLMTQMISWRQAREQLRQQAIAEWTPSAGQMIGYGLGKAKAAIGNVASKIASPFVSIYKSIGEKWNSVKKKFGDFKDKWKKRLTSVKEFFRWLAYGDAPSKKDVQQAADLHFEGEPESLFHSDFRQYAMKNIQLLAMITNTFVRKNRIKEALKRTWNAIKAPFRFARNMYYGTKNMIQGKYDTEENADEGFLTKMKRRFKQGVEESRKPKEEKTKPVKPPKEKKAKPDKPPKAWKPKNTGAKGKGSIVSTIANVASRNNAAAAVQPNQSSQAGEAGEGGDVLGTLANLSMIIPGAGKLLGGIGKWLKKPGNLKKTGKAALAVAAINSIGRLATTDENDVLGLTGKQDPDLVEDVEWGAARAARGVSGFTFGIVDEKTAYKYARKIQDVIHDNIVDNSVAGYGTPKNSLNSATTITIENDDGRETTIPLHDLVGDYAKYSNLKELIDAAVENLQNVWSEADNVAKRNLAIGIESHCLKGTLGSYANKHDLLNQELYFDLIKDDEQLGYDENANAAVVGYIRMKKINETMKEGEEKEAAKKKVKQDTYKSILKNKFPKNATYYPQALHDFIVPSQYATFSDWSDALYTKYVEDPETSFNSLNPDVFSVMYNEILSREAARRDWIETCRIHWQVSPHTDHKTYGSFDEYMKANCSADEYVSYKWTLQAKDFLENFYADLNAKNHLLKKRLKDLFRLSWFPESLVVADSQDFIALSKAKMKPNDDPELWEMLLRKFGKFEEQTHADAIKKYDEKNKQEAEQKKINTARANAISRAKSVSNKRDETLLSKDLALYVLDKLMPKHIDYNQLELPKGWLEYKNGNYIFIDYIARNDKKLTLKDIIPDPGACDTLDDYRLKFKDIIVGRAQEIEELSLKKGNPPNELFLGYLLPGVIDLQKIAAVKEEWKKITPLDAVAILSYSKTYWKGLCSRFANAEKPKENNQIQSNESESKKSSTGVGAKLAKGIPNVKDESKKKKQWDLPNELMQTRQYISEYIGTLNNNQVLELYSAVKESLYKDGKIVESSASCDVILDELKKSLTDRHIEIPRSLILKKSSLYTTLMKDLRTKGFNKTTSKEEAEKITQNASIEPSKELTSELKKTEASGTTSKATPTEKPVKNDSETKPAENNERIIGGKTTKREFMRKKMQAKADDISLDLVSKLSDNDLMATLADIEMDIDDKELDDSKSIWTRDPDYKMIHQALEEEKSFRGLSNMDHFSGRSLGAQLVGDYRKAKKNATTDTRGQKTETQTQPAQKPAATKGQASSANDNLTEDQYVRYKINTMSTKDLADVCATINHESRHERGRSMWDTDPIAKKIRKEAVTRKRQKAIVAVGKTFSGIPRDLFFEVLEKYHPDEYAALQKTAKENTRGGRTYDLDDSTGSKEIGQSFGSDGSWLGNFLGDEHSIRMPLTEGGSSWHRHGDESGPSLTDIAAMDDSGSQSMKVITPSNNVYSVTKQQPDRWDLLVQQLSTLTGNNTNAPESYIHTLEESVQRIEYLLETQVQGLNTLIVAVKDSGDETKRQILDAAIASYTNSVKTAETLLKNSTSTRNTSARTTAPAPVVIPYRK